MSEDDVFRLGMLVDFNPETLDDFALLVDVLGECYLLGKRPLLSPVPAIIQDYFGLTSTYELIITQFNALSSDGRSITRT